MYYASIYLHEATVSPIPLRDKGHNLLYCYVSKSSLHKSPLYNDFFIFHKSRVQYLLYFPTKTNTCKFSLCSFNANSDEASTVEILQPRAHMYTIINRDLTVVDFKSNKS